MVPLSFCQVRERKAGATWGDIWSEFEVTTLKFFWFVCIFLFLKIKHVQLKTSSRQLAELGLVQWVVQCSSPFALRIYLVQVATQAQARDLRRRQLVRKLTSKRNEHVMWLKRLKCVNMLLRTVHVLAVRVSHSNVWAPSVIQEIFSSSTFSMFNMFHHFKIDLMH